MVVCDIRVAVLLVWLLFVSVQTKAETFYELAAGGSKFALDITRKRGETFADDSQALNVSLGAYRRSSVKSAWGGVIEFSKPIDRDDLFGNGQILGFRPLNYLRQLNKHTSIEFYAGAAQYDWRKTANGYYFGTSARYTFSESNFAIGLDVKYYQDLAFDSAEGDDIVDGYNTGLKVFYRF